MTVHQQNHSQQNLGVSFHLELTQGLKFVILVSNDLNSVCCDLNFGHNCCASSSSASSLTFGFFPFLQVQNLRITQLSIGLKERVQSFCSLVFLLEQASQQSQAFTTVPKSNRVFQRKATVFQLRRLTCLYQFIYSIHKKCGCKML